MIQLLSRSKHLPCTCKHLNAVFRQTTPVHRAKYIIRRHKAAFNAQVRRSRCACFSRHASTRNNIITFALKFRMCDEAILKAMVNMKDCPIIPKDSQVRLPRWLFRNLENDALTRESHPLPLLRFLFIWKEEPSASTPDNCSTDGSKQLKTKLIQKEQNLIEIT